MRVAYVLLAVCMLSSCSVTMLQHDPVTAVQIDVTLEHEERIRAFLEGKLLPDDELEFNVMSDAEITRLQAWKSAEEAKKLEDQ